MNVFHKLKYARIYDAVLATPMTIGDVALGEIALGAAPRAAVLRGVPGRRWSVLGLVDSWWMLLSIRAAC